MERKKRKGNKNKTEEKKGEFRAGLYLPAIESRNTTPHSINGCEMRRVGVHVER
jgi:hypothetical protein